MGPKNRDKAGHRGKAHIDIDHVYILAPIYANDRCVYNYIISSRNS